LRRLASRWRGEQNWKNGGKSSFFRCEELPCTAAVASSSNLCLQLSLLFCLARQVLVATAALAVETVQQWCAFDGFL
jgi:hypothetical protein